MPKQLSMQTLLDAIQALGIDVPVMRAEQDDQGAITIFLYGGEVRHWPPAGQAQISPANPMPHFTPPPITRTELKKSQRAKKSQTKAK
jgi:hypothetical protein